MEQRLKGIGMTTSLTDVRATRVHCDADNLWVDLADGRQLGVPLAYFPRLLQASPAQREGCTISATGLHWDDLDEDISIVGLLTGIGDRMRKAS